MVLNIIGHDTIEWYIKGKPFGISLDTTEWYTIEW